MFNLPRVREDLSCKQLTGGKEGVNDLLAAASTGLRELQPERCHRRPRQHSSLVPAPLLQVAVFIFAFFMLSCRHLKYFRDHV
jgi:hypothetical protein